MSELKELKSYSVKEVAEIAKCSEETVRRAIRNGDMKANRKGKGYYIMYDEAVKWINS